MESGGRERLVEALNELLSAPENRSRWSAAVDVLVPLARRHCREWKKSPEPLPVELLAKVLALHPKVEGYNEQGYLDYDAARFRAHAAEALLVAGRHARVVVPALVRILNVELRGRCRDECCDANSIRIAQIQALEMTLVALRRIAPPGSLEISTATLADLMQPKSRRIAYLATELVSRSGAEATLYSAPLIRALAHPYPRVVESAARGVGRAGPPMRRKVVGPLLRLLHHPDARVRVEVVTALGACGGVEEARVRLEHLASADLHHRVRRTARRVLGSVEPPRSV
jgi:hypothetical protein